MKVISKEKMIDFIIKAQTGWKLRRNTKEYESRYKYLLSKSIDEIVKIYQEI